MKNLNRIGNPPHFCIGRLIRIIIILLCCLTFLFQPVSASTMIGFPSSSFKSRNNISSAFSFPEFLSWLFGDNTSLPDMPPFLVEKDHYVYKGGDLITSYSLDAPLYIESDMTFSSSISAKKIIVNANVDILSEVVRGQIIKGSLTSNEDFIIKKNGSLSMEKGTALNIKRNFESDSNKEFSLNNGTIKIQGNINIKSRWNSGENCIIKIEGDNTHILRGDDSCSVGMLAISENALNNIKFKKYFFQNQPKMFNVEKFCIRLPDSMIIQDYSSEISKTLHCMPLQSNSPYHVKRFAQNYLYTVLYCNGNMGSVSIDLFDTFFDVSADGPLIDSVLLENEKGLYLDAQRKVHSVKVDLSYIGTRNNVNSKSIGMGRMTINDEGTNYEFEFYPVIDENTDKDLNGFVDSLRKGASEAIKEQAKEIIIGQAISNLAEISAPEIYNLEIGNAICKAHSLYEFIDGLSSFTKKWNKMKNGLVLEPNTSIRIQAVEDHPQAGVTIYSSQSTAQEETDEKPSYRDIFLNIINDLISEYGMIRLVDNSNDWQESIGLCYLNLIDFTGDGQDELLAVCKKENEDHYTGYIYTEENGSALLLYENNQIEYSSYRVHDIVYIGYTEDTGYIFGTGWEDADADDRTFFWYKDGEFQPFYRSKGYWDSMLDDAVIQEEMKIVDVFDDDHRDELWENLCEVTLRTNSYDDINGNYFDSYELQRTIEKVIQELDPTPSMLSPEIILTGMDAIADAEIYMCYENDLSEWKPSSDNNYYFWSVIGNYGNSERRIDELNPTVTGDIGDAFIVDNNVIKNAAYAFFPDFDGSLPDFPSYPDMWLVREVGNDTVTLGYGDSGVMTERSTYKLNADNSIDVNYTASYFQDGIEPIADYLVHMEINPNYDKCNDYFTYYYTITSIEKINDYSESDSNNWKEAYADYIKSDIVDVNSHYSMDEPFESHTDYYFIYVDEDSIPEVVINYNVRAEGMKILTYYNGQLCVGNLLPELRYIENGGLLHAHIMQMGCIVDKIYELRHGELLQLGEGEGIPEDQASLENYTYTWDGEDIDEENYQKKIDSLINSSQTVSVFGNAEKYSYDECLGSLSSVN